MAANAKQASTAKNRARSKAGVAPNNTALVF
jgi:hypothetical protein